MDNFSQEETKKEIKPASKSQGLGTQEGKDIEFDENINIEDLQNLLQQHMEQVVSTIGEDDDEDTYTAIDAPRFGDETGAQVESSEQSPKEVPLVIDPSAKKYVVYIDPENIEFIEKLSLSERKLIINKILTERNALILKQKQRDQTSRYLRHSIVAALTVIIGFPILFVLVNRSLEISITNYKNARENFGTLYREQGKIKQMGSASIKDIKY